MFTSTASLPVVELFEAAGVEHSCSDVKRRPREPIKTEGNLAREYTRWGAGYDTRPGEGGGCENSYEKCLYGNI
eukprot:scaffold225574_cov39-Prasinocladus_malaysianus.AAC.1